MAGMAMGGLAGGHEALVELLVVRRAGSGVGTRASGV
jgi:hypothetical protein